MSWLCEAVSCNVHDVDSWWLVHAVDLWEEGIGERRQLGCSSDSVEPLLLCSGKNMRALWQESLKAIGNAQKSTNMQCGISAVRSSALVQLSGKAQASCSSSRCLEHDHHTTLMAGCKPPRQRLYECGRDASFASDCTLKPA